MRKYIIIVMGLILVSCKHDLTKVEKKLVDPKKKWVAFTHNGRITQEIHFPTYLKFFENGTLIEYTFGSEEQFGKSTWSYSKDDNVLELYDHYVFKDVTIYEDSIVMKDSKDNDNRVRLLNWNKLPDK